MSLKLNVALRTRNRVDKQATLKAFYLLELAQNVHWLDLRIITPRSEYKQYVKTNPGTKPYMRVVPDEYQSGDVFQYVLDSTDGLVFCLDDDLSLGRRRDRLAASQKGSRATLTDVRSLLRRIMSWLAKGYVHGGLSLRQNNHYVVGSYHKTTTRICCGASFWNAPKLRDTGVRFDVLQARSCCHVWLSLLEMGFDNVCDYEFFIGQATNSKGGCSDYRTPEFMRRQAMELVRLHPEVVKPWYKQRSGKEYDAIRTDKGVPDVRVSWKKALSIKQEEL